MTTKVPGLLISPNSLITENYGNDSITHPKLANNTLVERHYSVQSIPSTAYKLESVTSAVLGVNSVISIKIADNALLERHYSSQSIPASAYKLNSVATNVLVDLSVNTAKLANSSVTTDKLGSKVVTGVKIGDEAISTLQLNNHAVTSIKIAKGTKGDMFVATGEDGTFTNLSKGAEASVLSIVSGVPTWTNNVLPTGTILEYTGKHAPEGWVLSNGQTIGSSASAASIKGADLQNLFIHLWDNFNNSELPVSGGRGANAAADWTANKTIALPDFRGRSAIGRDSMENGTSNRLQDVTNSDHLGVTGGASNVTLTEAHVPKHTHFIAVKVAGLQHMPASEPTASNSINWCGRGGNINYALRPPINQGNIPNVAKTSPYGGNTSIAEGQSVPHENLPPFLIVTKIIKK